MHLTASSFGVIFVLANEALLTQGEDNKGKSAQKSRCVAIRVQLPDAIERGKQI